MQKLISAVLAVVSIFFGGCASLGHKEYTEVVSSIETGPYDLPGTSGEKTFAYHGDYHALCVVSWRPAKEAGAPNILRIAIAKQNGEITHQQEFYRRAAGGFLQTFNIGALYNPTELPADMPMVCGEVPKHLDGLLWSDVRWLVGQRELMKGIGRSL